MRKEYRKYIKTLSDLRASKIFTEEVDSAIIYAQTTLFYTEVPLAKVDLVCPPDSHLCIKMPTSSYLKETRKFVAYIHLLFESSGDRSLNIMKPEYRQALVVASHVMYEEMIAKNRRSNVN